MLTNDQRYLLSLLRQSLKGTEEPVEIENENAVAHMITRSGLLLTVYPAIKKQAGQSAAVKRLEELLRPLYFSAAGQSVSQTCENRSCRA